MGKTVRIRDDQYNKITSLMGEEDDFSEALERALSSKSQYITTRPIWADELKSEIIQEVKMALKSALSGR